MTEQSRHERPRRCDAIGALTVGGRVVGQIRCELDAGHDVITTRNAGFPDEWYGRTSHRATLEWLPESEPDLDLFDPAETFDVEVKIPGADECIVDGCRRPRGHDGAHDAFAREG